MKTAAGSSGTDSAPALRTEQLYGKGHWRSHDLRWLAFCFDAHLDRCRGEYFFRLVPGDPDGAQYFTALISLRNDIPVKDEPQLACALGIMDFRVRSQSAAGTLI